MKKFMSDHPITTFLIVDTIVCGIINIVRILSGGRKSDEPEAIETTFVDE